MKTARRILVVEDDPLIAEIMATVVRQACGYVETVGTMGAAKAALNGPGFDVVLLDLQLPDSNSERTIASIADLKRLGARNVIIVTGSPVDDRLLQAGLDAGALDVMGKDVDLKERLARLVIR